MGPGAIYRTALPTIRSAALSAACVPADVLLALLICWQHHQLPFCGLVALAGFLIALPASCLLLCPCLLPCLCFL